MRFLKYWQVFRDRLYQRLKSGHDTYGDESFNKPLTVVIDEIQQELEDVCGWGLIAWARLQAMRVKAQAIEPEQRFKVTYANGEVRYAIGKYECGASRQHIVKIELVNGGVSSSS